MTQQGSLRRRGNSWTAYWFVTDRGGERRQKSKGGFATKRDAQAFLTEQLASLATARYVEPSKLTFGEYLTNYWLPTVRGTTRPSTWDSYQRTVDLHVLPELGATPLQKLSAHDLDRYYAEKRRTGRVDGTKGLSAKTVRNIHNMIHKALHDAERKQLVTRNVAKSSDPPRHERRVLDGSQTWTPDQVRTFLAAMSDHRMYAAFLLAITTGMRRGEILGLRWIDIEFPQRRLLIRQTIISVAYELQYSKPKTNKGRRSIALDDTTLRVLREHRRTQARERSITGTPTRDSDLVFAREDGTPIHPDLFSQVFDRAVARLDVPRIRLHDLRHTHATLGLAAGIQPKVMSERLGHATVAFTQDVYVHAIPEREEEAASTIAGLIFPSTQRGDRAEGS